MRERRSLLVIAASCIMLMIVMVPLLTSDGGEALAEAPAEAVAVQSTENLSPAGDPQPGPQRGATPDAPTEAQVGALMLSGRRHEALTLYRQLVEMRTQPVNTSRSRKPKIDELISCICLSSCHL